LGPVCFKQSKMGSKHYYGQVSGQMITDFKSPLESNMMMMMMMIELEWVLCMIPHWTRRHVPVLTRIKDWIWNSSDGLRRNKLWTGTNRFWRHNNYSKVAYSFQWKSFNKMIRKHSTYWIGAEDWDLGLEVQVGTKTCTFKRIIHPHVSFGSNGPSGHAVYKEGSNLLWLDTNVRPLRRR